MSSPLTTGLLRGARQRCPNCGEGRLFRAYLKVESPCAACGHDNGHYRADDAPPYFTILIVGHLIIAPMLVFPFIWTWPLALVLGLTLPAIAILTLLILPRVKGAVIGFHWAAEQGAAAQSQSARPQSARPQSAQPQTARPGPARTGEAGPG